MSSGLLDIHTQCFLTSLNLYNLQLKINSCFAVILRRATYVYILNDFKNYIIVIKYAIYY